MGPCRIPVGERAAGDAKTRAPAGSPERTAAADYAGLTPGARANGGEMQIFRHFAAQTRVAGTLPPVRGL